MVLNSGPQATTLSGLQGAGTWAGKGCRGRWLKIRPPCPGNTRQALRRGEAARLGATWLRWLAGVCASDDGRPPEKTLGPPFPLVFYGPAGGLPLKRKSRATFLPQQPCPAVTWGRAHFGSDPCVASQAGLLVLLQGSASGPVSNHLVPPKGDGRQLIAQPAGSRREGFLEKDPRAGGLPQSPLFEASEP